MEVIAWIQYWYLSWGQFENQYHILWQYLLNEVNWSLKSMQYLQLTKETF